MKGSCIIKEIINKSIN